MLFDFAWVIIALATGIIGAAKGHDFITWVAIGIIASPGGLLAVLLMENVNEGGRMISAECGNNAVCCRAARSWHQIIRHPLQIHG